VANLEGRTTDLPIPFAVQPWQFGHGPTKRTCIWLKNLPLLKPTDVAPPQKNNLQLDCFLIFWNRSGQIEPRDMYGYGRTQYSVS